MSAKKSISARNPTKTPYLAKHFEKVGLRGTLVCPNAFEGGGDDGAAAPFDTPLSDTFPQLNKWYYLVS